MKVISQNTNKAIERFNVSAELLVWMELKRKSDGAGETLGLWTGAEPRQFTIQSKTRTYHGAGALLEIPPVQTAEGLDVRVHEFRLSNINQETADMVKDYKLRDAPFQLHRAFFDFRLEGTLADEPHLLLEGFIDKVDILTPAVGEEGAISVQVVGNMSRLTRTLPLRMSDEDGQKASGDRILRYSSTSETPTWWGQTRERAG